MLPQSIYEESGIAPAITISEIKAEDLGERVIRVTCLANGKAAKRLTQDIYGQPVNKIPVWCISNRIVSDWFAILLEEAYQMEVAGKTLIVH